MEKMCWKSRTELIRPERLHKGDTIGFIAPCYALKKENAERAGNVLEKLGFRVKYAEHLFSTAWDFSGTAQERADDFHQMILDDDVKMLLFTGGEVSTHLLPLLDYELIRKHPKIISSFSDSTSLLNAVSCRSGLVTFYGQSIRTFEKCYETIREGKDLPYNLQVFMERLVEVSSRYKAAAPWRVLCEGHAEGTLTGGYLVNYTLLQDTPYYSLKEEMRGEERGLLFLEDHEKFNEPAAVSRYLSCLEQEGVFEKASGLIFGHYSENAEPFYEGSNKSKDEIVDEILFRIGEKHRIPVVRTDDFGHGACNQILPIGVRAVLDAREKNVRFELCESGVAG